MTQLNNVQPEDSMKLRNMLRLIAHSTDLEDVMPTVLQSACQISHGKASFYYVLDEMQTTFVFHLDANDLPSPDIIETYVQDENWVLDAPIPAGLVDTYPNWLLIPIYFQDDLLGILGVLFANLVTIDDGALDTLEALVDAVTVATHNAVTELRHHKLMQNQNEFVRIVSHDLRSPLTSIKGFASMLESQMVGDLNEKQAHFVEKILAGIAQMTSLVDNIQDAGRYDPETGFYEMERAPADIIEIVQKIANNHLLPAEKQELTLTVRTSDDIPIMNIDADMVERSITNLVDNAIKYTPNGGQVEVAAKRDGDRVFITVTDNGYGISKENLDNLFQRHFRIRRKEHNRVKGSGLGLFIVRSVAQQHGGNAFVESAEGQGSTFGIYIPLEGDNLVGK